MSPQFGPFKEKKSVSLKLSKMKDIYNYFLKIVNNSWITLAFIHIEKFKLFITKLASPLIEGQ